MRDQLPSPRLPRGVQGLAALLCSAAAACGPTATPSWPEVRSAPLVPMSHFHRAAPVPSWAACWLMDPTGSAVVVQISAGRILADGELVATYEGGDISPAPEHASLIEPLYDTLQAISDTHIDAARHDCAPMMRGTFLLEVDATVSQVILQAVLYTAANARYTDPWLRVNARGTPVRHTAPPLAIPPPGVESCVQHWVVQVDRAGHARATRIGEDMTRVPAVGGAPDIEGLAARVTDPIWAQPSIAFRADRDGDVQQLATVFADLPEQPPLRIAHTLWTHSTPHPGFDSGVHALPIAWGHPPGECLFASQEPTCMGLDGERHPWVGDPCWNRADPGP